MGLLDRDYMHQRDTKRNSNKVFFSGGSHNKKSSHLKWILILALIIAINLFLWNYKSKKQPATAHINIANASTPKPVDVQEKAQIVKPYSASEAQINDKLAEPARVFKCTSNGKVFYTNQNCPAGASGVEIAQQHSNGLAPANKPATVDANMQRIATKVPQVPEISSHTPISAISPQAECEALNNRVNQLDALARKNSRDWMREERKKARDRQFQIGC